MVIVMISACKPIKKQSLELFE